MKVFPYLGDKKLFQTVTLNIYNPKTTTKIFVLKKLVNVFGKDEIVFQIEKNPCFWGSLLGTTQQTI